MAGKSDDVKVAIELGKDAVSLIEANGERLADRLRAGTRDGLAADVGFLAGAQSGAAGAARRDARLATREERAIAERAARAISRIRNAIRDAKVDAATATKWGVGIAVDAGTNRTVLAAGSAIVSRARANPDEARAVELTAFDIDGLAGDLARLDPADTAQRTKRGDSKAATKAEDGAIERIFAAVRHVGSAGELEFGHENGAPEGREPDRRKASVRRAARTRHAALVQAHFEEEGRRARPELTAAATTRSARPAFRHSSEDLPLRRAGRPGRRSSALAFRSDVDPGASDARASGSERRCSGLEMPSCGS